MKESKVFTWEVLKPKEGWDLKEREVKINLFFGKLTMTVGVAQHPKLTKFLNRFKRK